MISEIVLNEPLLLLLQRATHATLQVLLADLDVTASELNALANMADGRSRTVSELGEATGTRPTTLTGVLDRLERRGYLARGAHAGDRRAVSLTLTSAGTSAASAVRTAIDTLEGELLRDLPPDALATARAVLDRLAAA